MSPLLMMVTRSLAFDSDADGADDSLACRPFSAAVGQTIAENGVDTVDSDCDGSDSIRREFVRSIEYAAGIQTPDDSRHPSHFTRQANLNPRGCTTDDYSLNGVHSSRDGRWLFFFGGSASLPDSSATALTEVCAVDLDSGGAGLYLTLNPVVSQNVLQMSTNTLVSHPHIEDLWYFGGNGSDYCQTECTPPGIFALQRRRRLYAGAWQWNWGFYRVSDDELEGRSIADLDLGPGYVVADDATAARQAPVKYLYSTSTGSSFWDGEVSW